MNNNKIITRNKNSLPVNFCTTGNFLNINKIKFIPIDKSIKANSKKVNKKNSSTKNSEPNSKQEESKDELIKKLKERIIFLENKIKILESEKEINKKPRKNSHSRTFILKMNSLNKSLHKSNSKVTTIPIDKNLLKTKLNKKKKNLCEIFDMNKKSIVKKNRTNSFYFSELNMSKHNNNTINNSLLNCYSNNNSCTGSSYKSKKKSINLINKSNTIYSLNNLLYFISSKTAKSKASSSIDHKRKKSSTGMNGGGGRKANAIPKKGRKNFNASPKMMMSSTNYSNNISNSFKDDINMKKFIPKKILENGSFCEKKTFSEMKNKLEDIQKRTKNLLGFYSSFSIDKIGVNQINNNSNINKENFFTNYSHYIKINKKKE